ncbi:hypothetical protein DNTS_032244 [Danionella cerebrum]|uniref:Diphthamide biosynthesis protein 3 n=1 Tax=Danionella cerebrum TaxID=2873325 RepID=A0A553NAH8_9TELE|nr:hypothetical protein DNTS_032244 [Danionella translucida]
MSVFHDEIEIEDFEYDDETETYYFPCPCGDRFAITKARFSFYMKHFLLFQEDLENGEEEATCPSCSLVVRVIYDKDQFMTGEIIEAPASSDHNLEVAQN